MKKASLILTPGKGKVKITPRGLEALAQNQEKISINYLMQFEEFREFRQAKKSPPGDVGKESPEIDKTPEEILAENYLLMRGTWRRRSWRR